MMAGWCEVAKVGRARRGARLKYQETRKRKEEGCFIKLEFDCYTRVSVLP
jgi:hypothetical protein